MQNQIPEYLQMSKKERENTKKKLLFVPIICLLILSLLLIGELFPSTRLYSFTKIQYLIKANSIARQVSNGDFQDILTHTMKYYDSECINYMLVGDINDVYGDTVSSMEDIYNETIANSKMSAIMANIYYSQNGYYMSNLKTDVKSDGTWKSIGFITKDKKDFIMVSIDFKSLEDYDVTLSMTIPAPQKDLSENEYKQYIEEYKRSDIYLKWNYICNKLSWFKNTISTTNTNQYYLDRVLRGNNTNEKSIQNAVNSLFSNKNRNDYSKYLEQFSKYLLKLTSYYEVKSAIITDIEYNKELSSLISVFKIDMVDNSGISGEINILCLYTPYGYQMVPYKVQLLSSYAFDAELAAEFINAFNLDFIEFANEE